MPVRLAGCGRLVRERLRLSAGRHVQPAPQPAPGLRQRRLHRQRVALRVPARQLGLGGGHGGAEPGVRAGQHRQGRRDVERQVCRAQQVPLVDDLVDELRREHPRGLPHRRGPARRQPGGPSRRGQGERRQIEFVQPRFLEEAPSSLLERFGRGAAPQHQAAFGDAGVLGLAQGHRAPQQLHVEDRARGVAEGRRGEGGEDRGVPPLPAPEAAGRGPGAQGAARGVQDAEVAAGQVRELAGDRRAVPRHQPGAPARGGNLGVLVRTHVPQPAHDPRPAVGLQALRKGAGVAPLQLGLPAVQLAQRPRSHREAKCGGGRPHGDDRRPVRLPVPLDLRQRPERAPAPPRRPRQPGAPAPLPRVHRGGRGVQGDQAAARPRVLRGALRAYHRVHAPAHQHDLPHGDARGCDERARGGLSPRRSPL
mmetsp:Transcript_56837/g.173064  ORF Transcript_56837/g.173064 Transcript_56837/m.173064 type:complete len:422 (+) Transcript_56837:2808-4073(+)